MQHFGFFEDYIGKPCTPIKCNTCYHFSLSHVLILNFTSSSRYQKICVIGVQFFFLYSSIIFLGYKSWHISAIWSSLCSWNSMYRFIPLLIFLVPQDSNLTHYAQVCWLCCVLYMPLFGLVQARPWFRSSMWISSVAGISKVLCTSEVASATRTW